MSKATQQNITLSALFADPLVADAFRRAERDNPDAVLVPAQRPEPVLTGSDAVRVLELA